MHKNQLCPTEENSLDDRLLRDGEGNMVLGSINERSLLLPIYNIYCVVAYWRWWWTVQTWTISGVTMRIMHCVTAL
jgi:hypothetical protein